MLFPLHYFPNARILSSEVATLLSLPLFDSPCIFLNSQDPTLIFDVNISSRAAHLISSAITAGAWKPCRCLAAYFHSVYVTLQSTIGRIHPLPNSVIIVPRIHNSYLTAFGSFN